MKKTTKALFVIAIVLNIAACVFCACRGNFVLAAINGTTAFWTLFIAYLTILHQEMVNIILLQEEIISEWRETTEKILMTTKQDGEDKSI